MKAKDLKAGTIFFFFDDISGTFNKLTAYRRTATGCTNLVTKSHCRFAGLYKGMAETETTTEGTGINQ